MLVLALAIGFPLSLEPLREPVAAAASQALGRRVRITGPLGVVPAFSPTLEIRGFGIANPPDWPKGELAQLDAELSVDIDLGAVNLLMAVIPVVDSGGDSILNCAVASLELKDGVMTERSILVDTSRMRISGKAAVNFHERRIQMRLTPRAKRPELFSLATPVNVEGSFDDFGAGVKPLALVGSVIRLATGVIEVPARYLVDDVLPVDGTADCREALERVGR